MHMMGAHAYGKLLVDRLEYGDADEGDSQLWDVRAWYGGDYRKLWFETEGEGGAGDAPDVAELQLRYDRTFAPFWSWQAGIRHDLRQHAEDTSYLAVGLHGLAPQWLETDLSAYLSDDGDLSVRAELEYDLLITQRLILQPHLELDASMSRVDGVDLGRGISGSEAGLRLRYEIRPELAPYLGVRWERSWGNTRDLRRAAGEPTSSTSLVIGVRAWF
ncbi:MAG: copper resistance protein B [Pseudomonadales bacterium]